jgi:hypothetical protein
MSVQPQDPQELIGQTDGGKVKEADTWEQKNWEPARSLLRIGSYRALQMHPLSVLV